MLLKIIVLIGLLAAAPASAQQTSPAETSAAQKEADRKAEFQSAADAADAAAIAGPRDIKLADKGTFHLPAGASWIPHGPADRFMRAAGHQPDPNLLGIISGATGDHGWIAVVEFAGDGYVKDDEAKDLDPAKLLAALREGAEEDNKTRVERGFEPLVLDEWLQPPVYDASTKRLVWALPVHTAATADRPTINYNTRALGREGYISLNLLTDKAHFEAEKGVAAALLKDIDYAPGHRYVDFNPSTDHVAAYGLAALIGAVALKKLGILAVASAFILKFAKIGVVAVIAVFAGLKRLLSGRKKGDPSA